MTRWRLILTLGAAVALAAMPTRAADTLVNPSTPACLDASGNPWGASPTHPCAVMVAPSSASAVGITPVLSSSAESSHVLKATAGNLYRVYATNQTGTAGFLMVFNATSAPSDGAVTPQDCTPLPGNSAATLVYADGPPSVFSTGIVAVVSSGTNCFTKTTGVITAFIHGDVQ